MVATGANYRDVLLYTRRRHIWAACWRHVGRLLHGRQSDDGRQHNSLRGIGHHMVGLDEDRQPRVP